MKKKNETPVFAPKALTDQIKILTQQRDNYKNQLSESIETCELALNQRDEYHKELKVSEDRIKELQEKVLKTLKGIEWLKQSHPEIKFPEELPEYGIITRNEAQRIQAKNEKQYTDKISELQEENKKLKVQVSDLLMFCEADNTLLNGFMTQDIIQKLRKLV